MAEVREIPWGDVLEVMHSLLTSIVVRGQYPVGHPAIDRADETVTAALMRVGDRLPELVIAIVEKEFVVAERPMPELRERLPGFAELLLAHGVECLIFVRGAAKVEITTLASTLASAPSDDPARQRERLQALLPHVLLRYVNLRGQQNDDEAEQAESHAPAVSDAIAGALVAFARGTRIDETGILHVARDLFDAVTRRAAPLTLRSFDPTDDGAGHATNVAIMTCAMMMEMGATDAACVDGIAAALLHDVGCALLPEEIRGQAEPLLDERGRKMYRFHPILGARALLLAGAPGTWVETALQHHRGVDLGGYPALENDRPPHELARIVALANFVERKRTSLAGALEAPERAVFACQELLGRFFDGRAIAMLMRALGIFPPGTTVELSSGETAVVTRVYVGEPLRPRVRILFGPDTGKRADLREFDALEKRYSRSIVKAVAPPLAVVEEK
jgi:HD-GYP domain-containing protein (c-di-GMP phosphodiesterase class II)